MKVFFKIMLISVLLFSCSEIEEKEKGNSTELSNTTTKTDITEVPVPKGDESELNIFEHKIPDSELSYNIEITKIKFKEKKNAFEIVKEKYSKPESINGMTLKVNFKITNPYDKEMRIPLPNYFFITSPLFNRGVFIYSKTCKGYIKNTTKITNVNGVPLNKLAKRIDGNYMVDFNKNESKEFVINFSDNFPKIENLETITLGGFNKHLHKKIKAGDFYKLSDSEKKKSLADKSKIYALEISIKDENIISKKEYVR